MFKRLFIKKKRSAFLEITYRDKPGFSHPTMDDLRFEALEFERLIFDYIRERKKSPIHEKAKLRNLVETELVKYPPHPPLDNFWPAFIERAAILTNYRNSIAHSDFSELPPLAKTYKMFRSANKILSPLRICSGNRERFKPVAWHGNNLELMIDGHRYLLSPADLSNLTIELNPSCRGQVNFIKGRMVTAKALNYDSTTLTYFIEDYPSFELNEDDAMTLDDMLSSVIGRFMYSKT
jgi:hypothetical protein